MPQPVELVPLCGDLSRTGSLQHGASDMLVILQDPACLTAGVPVPESSRRSHQEIVHWHTGSRAGSLVQQGACRLSMDGLLLSEQPLCNNMV